MPVLKRNYRRIPTLCTVLLCAGCQMGAGPRGEGYAVDLGVPVGVDTIKTQQVSDDRQSPTAQTVSYIQDDESKELPFEVPSETKDALQLGPVKNAVKGEMKLPGEANENELSVINNPVQDTTTRSYELPTAINGLPVDFATVLRLAGADNLNVRIARERICEAMANHDAARAAWLPTLNFGVGFNHHEGQIQATDGTVSQVSRGSLFVGGGSKIGDNPLAGGSGGPARLTVNLSIADAIFQPLATRQLVEAEQFRESRVFNDVMLNASLAYYDLVRAQSVAAIAMENQEQAEVLLKLTSEFVEGGKGTVADTNRVQVIVNQRRNDVATAQAQIGLASARLANVLQLDYTKLDPNQGLFALEANTMPIELVQSQYDLASLVSQALMTRNEVSEADMRAHAAQTQSKVEQVRPFMPNLSVGNSGGFFGGGPGSDLPKLDSRNDIDIQLTWEIQNMGAGNRAARNRRRSQLNQALYAGQQIKDQVANEVATAYQRVKLYERSMEILRDSVEQAENALRLNIEAIKGLEGLPLESVQSVNALAQARTEYLESVINYNRSQLQLMRAIGEPIANHSVASGAMPAHY